MVKVKTLRTFYDLHHHADRKPGEVFEAPEERVARIQQMLPGYIEVVEEVDYTKMSVQELIALAKERGVMPKGRTSKATLIEILSKE